MHCGLMETCEIVLLLVTTVLHRLDEYHNNCQINAENLVNKH